jgi:hypothetical protein
MTAVPAWISHQIGPPDMTDERMNDVFGQMWHRTGFAQMWRSRHLRLHCRALVLRSGEIFGRGIPPHAAA